MARMYPGTLPEHVLKNPKLSSEVRVYNTIRDRLPADYRCYYSRSWHAADGDGGEFDGEADFIVSHRENGLLFLEVKGGRVSCRETDNQWLTTDRDDFTFKITSPVTQAMKSKHHFLKRLKDRIGNRYIRARHGVILPGSKRLPRRQGHLEFRDCRYRTSLQGPIPPLCILDRHRRIEGPGEHLCRDKPRQRSAGGCRTPQRHRSDNVLELGHTKLRGGPRGSAYREVP